MTKTLKKLVLFLSLAFLTIFLTACGGGHDDTEIPPEIQSSSKSITAFSIAGVPAIMTGQQLQVTVPNGTDVRRLVATFTTSGLHVAVTNEPQVSGFTVQDFSSPVAYVLTAADGTTATYTVTVIEAPSQAKAISAFSIDGVEGVIHDHDIALTLPHGSDPTRRVATFSTSGKTVAVDGAPQTSGTTVLDYSSPVTYVVTAADGSTDRYTVVVTVAPSEAKSITAFSIAGVSATIDGPSISLTLPFGMSPAGQIATFETTGASVLVGGTAQVSGRTSQDFSRPVTYVVNAANGSTASYTVVVSVALSQARAITAFSLGGVAATISGNDIAVTLPAGADAAHQVASFVTTGASVSVKGATQVSGGMAQDFSQPVSYVVRAADGSTASYTVTVTVAKSASKAITSYYLYGARATFRERSPGQFLIDAPIYSTGGGTGLDIIQTSPIYVKPTFTISAKSITIDGVPQVSGESQINIRHAGRGATSPTPVIYVVTAEDGTQATYTLQTYSIQVVQPTPAPTGN